MIIIITNYNNNHQTNIIVIREVADKVFEEKGKRVQYKIGTMIEVPRAALIAGELAKAGAEFFSYGTNDLTQVFMDIFLCMYVYKYMCVYACICMYVYIWMNMYINMYIRIHIRIFEFFSYSTNDLPGMLIYIIIYGSFTSYYH
jgi:hypothetical protein